MTLGIVVPLPDGVLFVADGKLVNLFGETEPESNVSKIHQIAVDVALISFGLSGVTDHFLQTLKSNFPIPSVSIGSTPEEIAWEIDVLLARVWEHVSFPEGTDLANPAMVAGFAFGGLASGSPFIGSTVRSRQGSLGYKVTSDPRYRVVLGGVGIDAQAIYLKNENVALRMNDKSAGTKEPTVYYLIRGAADTIREVEKCDSSVGGTIEYAFFTGAPNINPMVRGTLPSDNY